MTATSQGITGRSELQYACTDVSNTTVTVCADGSALSTTPVCESFPVPTNPFFIMNALPGYENFTCNMQLGVDDSCGCDFLSPLIQCQQLFPPSPPAPPPPPPFRDYPHSTCFPGNSEANRGFGSGTGVGGIAWDLRMEVSGQRNLTFNMFPNPACDPAFSGDMACCDMSLGKVEIVLNPRCRGAIETIVVPEGSPVPTLPSYSVQNWPRVVPEGLSSAQMTAHIGGLTQPDGRLVTTFTVVLREDSVCNTVDTFLFEAGTYWFAIFGTTEGNRVYGCCGTNTYPNDA
eukprot:19370-Chlamydomonas_euryale.AAC.10